MMLNIFSCAHWLFVYFLDKYLFKFFVHFKIELFVFLLTINHLKLSFSFLGMVFFPLN